MSKAKNGDTVKVHYTGKFENGDVFDTSDGREPLSFTLGKGQLIPGFEKSVEGMDVGEEKTITLAPQEGYGERDDQLVKEFPRTSLPENMKVEIGSRLRMNTTQGQVVDVTVVEFDEKTVTIDANHPLAGQTLVFDIRLEEIDSGTGTDG